MIYLQTELHNCCDIVKDAYSGQWKMTRVPEWVREKMSPIGRKYTAYNTPHTEIRFCMEEDTVTLGFEIFHPEGANYGIQALEVFFGCFQEDGLKYLQDDHCQVILRRPENMELLKRISEENRLPFSPEVVRVIAPGDCHLMLKDVQGKIHPPEAFQLPTMRWLAYGSSITQGSNGLHPSGGYAAITAELLGVELLNMGFGGSAVLEPEMADFLAERPDFDFLTLEMGINMTWDIEHNCMGDPELFRRRVDYFVSRIAGAHPDKYVFCLDLFPNKDDYTGSGQSACYREIVRRKVLEMRSDKVVYLNGLQYLSKPSHLCTDLIHPSAAGCAEIGRRLALDLKGYLKL